MGKDTYYFSHDYNARTDEKIKLLIRKHGLLGYGIFWAIVEDLYNNANALRTDYEGIAFELRTDVDLIKSVINDFNLFQTDGDVFGSLSVQTRLNERLGKSQSARESAFKRWAKPDTYANALRTQSEGNAINEKKEKKGNDISATTLDLVEKLFIASTLDKNWTISFCEKEAVKFYNFYASKNWMVGKNKMKSLSHAIGGWISRIDKPELTTDQKEESEIDYARRMWMEKNGGN